MVHKSCSLFSTSLLIYGHVFDRITHYEEVVCIVLSRSNCGSVLYRLVDFK